MTPWLDDGDVRLYHGDALECLRDMPSEHAQCIVTSPPFWGLRDYGEAGQIGLESHPRNWRDRLVRVFRECRRVLRSDGVMWLEVGDTYATRWSSVREEGRAGLGTQDRDRKGAAPEGFKSKDLVGAPWLLAFALRADGWYLRSDTIWSRPNPMPESVTDRPTKSHSYVFLMSKSARYFYDADAIREGLDTWAMVDGEMRNTAGGQGNARHRAAVGRPDAPEMTGNMAEGKRISVNPAGRNARSVWSISTEPTPFSHFATFPTELVRRCIAAGTSEHGACSECGAPWRRITETKLAEPNYVSGKNVHNGGRNDKGRTMFVGGASTTLGWEPSCDHDAPVVPCVVLDCFMGSGTTALVARRLGRHAIGIELNAEYLEIAAKRLQQLSLFSTDANPPAELVNDQEREAACPPTESKSSTSPASSSASRSSP